MEDHLAPSLLKHPRLNLLPLETAEKHLTIALKTEVSQEDSIQHMLQSEPGVCIYLLHVMPETDSELMEYTKEDKNVTDLKLQRMVENILSQESLKQWSFQCVLIQTLTDMWWYQKSISSLSQSWSAAQAM